jgi:hypothetical protein
MLGPGTPFSAAFIPLVPLASSGGSGVWSHTSTPEVSRRPQLPVTVFEINDAHVRAERVAHPDDLLDGPLPGVIPHVRLAAADDLKGTLARRDLPQSHRLGGEKLGPLVGSGPAGETDSECFKVEVRARPAVDLLDGM